MKEERKKVILFGGSMNPPGLHHRKIVEALAREFPADTSTIRVIPCGYRPDKDSVNDIDPIHRAVMCDMTFQDIAEHVHVDLFDLEADSFSPAWRLEERYQNEGEVWHAVGGDLIVNGKNQQSLIQTTWERGKDVWDHSTFIVLWRDGSYYSSDDLPPNFFCFDPRAGMGSSKKIRQKCFHRESIEGLVTPGIEEYIDRYNLYRGRIRVNQTFVRFTKPRLLINYDEKNEAVWCIRDLFAPYEDIKQPNAVVAIGGDGTMLKTIHSYWRLRLPFIGINVGRKGFLLNSGDIRNPKEFLMQEFVSMSSPLLHIEVTDLSGVKKQALAFNDAWIQVPPNKTGRYTLLVDGEEKIPDVIGNGLLVSTAAGSTAYAWSAGAMPVPVGTELLLLVGLDISCPRHWRAAANLPIQSALTFRSSDVSGFRWPSAYADGVDLGMVKEMSVRVSRTAAAEILFTKDRDAHRKLAEEQFPNA